MASRFWLQMQHGFGEKATAFKLVFETDHPTLENLIDELTLRGVVCGAKLFLEGGVGQPATVRERVPFALGVAGLVAVQPYNKEVRG